MAYREHDVDFDGINVHCYEGGEGFPILMLHGSGPGASSIGNWRLVLEPLSERYHVLAADLIGFGLSGRKPDEPYFDMALWQRQGAFLLDALGDGPIGIIGHSLSAALGLKLAAADRRISKVLATGAMGTEHKVSQELSQLWTFPETIDDLRAAMGLLLYDQSPVTEEFLQNRMEVLHSGDYEAYFSSMFGGDKQRYQDAGVVTKDELAKVTCDVLLVHGRDDLPVPFMETSLVLAGALAQADLVVLGRCGHGPALEHPGKLLALAYQFFG